MRNWEVITFIHVEPDIGHLPRTVSRFLSRKRASMFGGWRIRRGIKTCIMPSMLAFRSAIRFACSSLIKRIASYNTSSAAMLAGLEQRRPINGACRDLRGITCIASEWQLATRPSQTDDRSSHQVAPKAVEKIVAKSIMLAPHAVTIFRGGHTASRRKACAKKRQNRTKNWSNLTCATPGFCVACGDASLRVGRAFPTAAGVEVW